MYCPLPPPPSLGLSPSLLHVSLCVSLSVCVCLPVCFSLCASLCASLCVSVLQIYRPEQVIWGVRLSGADFDVWEPSTWNGLSNAGVCLSVALCVSLCSSLCVSLSLSVSLTLSLAVCLSLPLSVAMCCLYRVHRCLECRGEQEQAQAAGRGPGKRCSREGAQ